MAFKKVRRAEPICRIETGLDQVSKLRDEGFYSVDPAMPASLKVETWDGPDVEPELTRQGWTRPAPGFEVELARYRQENPAMSGTYLTPDAGRVTCTVAVLEDGKLRLPTVAPEHLPSEGEAWVRNVQAACTNLANRGTYKADEAVLRREMARVASASAEGVIAAGGIDVVRAECELREAMAEGTFYDKYVTDLAIRDAGRQACEAKARAVKRPDAHVQAPGRYAVNLAVSFGDGAEGPEYG